MARSSPLVIVLFLFLLVPSLAADVLLGSLSDDGGHDVSGTVYAVDSRTLRIESFTYDGRGPAGVYWVDEGSAPTASGVVARDQQTCEAVDSLPAFSGEDVVVELPTELSEVGYFSIWCEAVGVSFGGVAIDPEKVKDVLDGESKCEEGASPQVGVKVKLGKLSNDQGHGVAGTVYALDTMTLKIEGFKYDGQGPAVVYWIDEGSVATAKGVSALDQDMCETAEKLPEFTGEDVLVELPPGRELSSVGYFSIWCETFAVSFGGVAVDPAKVADLPAAEPKCSKSEPGVDKEVRIGKLSNLAGHGVGGTVFALNSRTLRVKNFRYDGKGPAGVFWVGTGKPDENGVVPLFRDDCSVEDGLPAFTGEDVDLELPNDLDLSSIEYLSVWCEQVAVDFGSVAIDADALNGVPDLESASCVPEEVAESEPFPVEEDWNCEELSEDFQVRWTVDGENLNVELVGRIGPDQYMGFGPSGSDNKTDMIGSDVVIAYQDGDDYAAVDYFMNARNPCTAGKGVCPDEKLTPKSGTDDVTAVSGKSERDLTMIRYTRPLSASDKDFDRPIITSDSMFVSWAIGPLNPSSKLPLFHLGDMAFPTSSVSIEFGRSTSNTCATKLLVATEDLSAVPGFERPTLSGVTEITARIGPPGGTRGYSGITGGPSWGFAWYMSPTGETGKDVLIPAIGVERGKTYMFTVQGGFDDGSGKAFHPLYITSSAMGGFGALSPEEREQETLYAGIEDIVKDPKGGITSFNAPAVGALCDITSSLEGDTDTAKSWADYFKTLDISCAEDEAITSESGKLEWTVPADAPDELYYQCVTHPFLGYKIVVFDEGKVDEELLSELNGGGKLHGEQGAGTGADGGNKRCSVEFKKEEKLFDGCRKGLDGDVDVYWTLREADGEIDTLFRAPTEGGYVGFGWGYSAMVGSHVVIAFQDASGESVIETYFLEEKSTKGVQPNDTLNLVSKDVEIVGDFVTGFFTRKLVVDGVPPLSGEETSAIWAVGAQPTSVTALTKHRIRSPGVFDLSSSPIDDGEDEEDQEVTSSPEDGDSGSGLPEDDGSVSASPEGEGGATDAGNGACTVTFKGEEKSFGGCQKGLDGGVDVYWTLRETDGEIDTLFRAPTEGGYVGFGWGYSAMVGSHVVIAFADASGEGTIGSYFLEARSPEGVQPNETLKLVEQDVEIEGDFVTGIFTRKLEIDGVPTVSREETSAIWAVGAQPTAPTALTRHTVQSTGVFDVSAPVIDDGGEVSDSATPSPEDGDGLDGLPEDEEDISASPENEDGDGACTVTFKGKEENFGGCRKGLDGDVDVYWSLRETDGEIDTLFRAPTEGGYVGFGWGHSTMVGSHVVIAFADASGEGVIGSYFLEARSPEGVQPNETLKLVKKDVEIEGGFVIGIFTRKLEVDGVPTISNGSTTAIWAVGAQPTSPTALSKHGVQSNGIFDISSSDTSPDEGQGGSGGDAEDGDKRCPVTFKGQEMVFRGCLKNLEHNFEVYWTVRENDGEIDTLFRARTDGYVGFGWGYSKMVGSDVVIALQEDMNGEVKIDDYLLQSKTTAGVQPNIRQRLTDKDAAIDGEYLAGRFTRKLEIEGLPKIRNGEMDVIWAVGPPPSSASGLEKHRGIAISTIDISNSSGGVSRSTGAFYIVHGVLMAVAWFVLTPTAIVGIRFFKEFNPLTFQLHRALNVLSVLFVVVAFIMGLSRGSRHYTAHLVIGCITFSLAILQVVGGVLRPQPRSGVRKPWYFAHMLNGYLTHGLGQANVWVGLGVIGAGFGYYIACGVLVGLYVLVQVLFSFMWKRFPTRVREEQFPDEAEAGASTDQGPDLT